MRGYDYWKKYIDDLLISRTYYAEIPVPDITDDHLDKLLAYYRKFWDVDCRTDRFIHKITLQNYKLG